MSHKFYYVWNSFYKIINRKKVLIKALMGSKKNSGYAC